MKPTCNRGPISGAQVRAARAFLGWTARALAKKAEVPEFTLEWIEGHGQISGKDLKALTAIQAQLEALALSSLKKKASLDCACMPEKMLPKGAQPRRHLRQS
jgi:hypothetical protein